MIRKLAKYTPHSENGYASFVITLITIVVVSLIVVAFAISSRLEQKNSLANNLATQAYYAAESGINDATTIVNAYVNNHQQPPQTNKFCANSPGGGNDVYINSGSNQLGINTHYSCVIVNPSPNSLQYQDVIPGEAYTIPVTVSGTLSQLTIGWESDAGGSANFGGCPFNQNPSGAATLPAIAGYRNCTAGVIQLDLISAGNLSHELSNNPYSSEANTVFLEPSSRSVHQSNVVSKNNQVFYVSCDTIVSPGAYNCSYTLDLTSLPRQSSTYYLHLIDYYVSSNVAISASNGGGPTPISGTQIEIDSTGVAGGQLKRIAEWVCNNPYCSSSGNNSLSSGAAIESTECVNKDFAVYAGYGVTTPADGPGASCP